jgi:4,5-DOPA dioxygenase extradiol
MLAWPAADIPVLQVSVQGHLGPTHHLELGRALAPLRARDVLVIGSGSFTHDLRRFFGQPVDAPEPPDVAAFSAWMDAAIREGRQGDLLAYRHKAPHAAEEHPTEEHLLPLFVAMGAAGPELRPEHLHAATEHGVLRMDAYAFH